MGTYRFVEKPGTTDVDVVLNNDSVLIDYSAQYKTPSPVSS